MFERVAVLSDVHAVLPALDAVLALPEVREADRLVLTGDVLVGPQPRQTMERLAELGERVVWVSGNCERATVELARGERSAKDDPTLAFAEWGAATLSTDHVDFLASLPKTVTLPVSGLGEVLFCHATPRDDEEFVLVDSSVARWNEVLAGVPDEVRTVVCGHTHMPFQRLVDRRTVLNPGSVGMPYGTSGAHWALLGGDEGAAVRLRRTVFGAEAAEESIKVDCDHPDLEQWLDHYLRATASDVEALEVFGPKARSTTAPPSTTTASAT
jgi:predicted phosphodiesterase